MEIVEQVMKASKIKELNPVQKLALQAGLLEGKNIVVFAPTSSGKTLIAEIAMLNTILNKKRKAIYLAPLVALASEKYESFKKKYEKLGLKVALSVGNYDSSDPFLAAYDIIVCTNEKFDSLIRHHAPWIEQVGIVVVDEIHLINDASRGPTLEILLTLIKDYLPSVQIIALSATISNARELAEWLNAELVYSDWRPVEIKYGIAYPNQIEFLDGKEVELKQDLVEGIVEYVLRKRKQALLFVSTRRRAEALAEKLSKIVEKFLGKNEKEMLAKLAEKIENTLDTPTKQCRREAKVVKKGVAFHHAGLLFSQKKAIEDAFKKRLLKVIVATPTLAWGVNLPSFLVAIVDAKRYYTGLGNVYLQNLEVHQMLGRSGRIDYDDHGEAIIVAKNYSEAEHLKQRYFYSDFEEIKSKLGVEPLLRTHILGLIATGIVNDERSLLGFFDKTFFSYQFGQTSFLHDKIMEILDFLVKHRFVKYSREFLEPTRLGKRVSELYLDPLTALSLVEYVKKNKFNDITTLATISSAIEMKPLPGVRFSEYPLIEDVIKGKYGKLFLPVPDEWDVDYEDFISSIKLATILYYWINEKTEEEIFEQFNITPGELYSRIQLAEWLSYALQEISLLKKNKELATHARKLMIRIKYGIKPELITLIKLEGIGRVKARKLYNAGIKTLSDLRKIPLQTLEKLIGPKTARKVKEQVSNEKEAQKDLNPSF